MRAAAALLALALALAAPATAQDCPVVMEPVTFCKEGTDWARVPMTPEVKDGKIANLTLYGPGTVLIFSQVPEYLRNTLPRSRTYDTAAEAAAGLLTLYKGATPLASFAPLGPDTAAATVAFHDGASGWVNMITYYLVDGANLTVQTGQQGTTTLTERHHDLHMQAVQALRSPE